MDLATLTAAPTTVTVGGRDFKIGPLRFLEYGLIQRFLSGRHEKPPLVGSDTNWPAVLFSEIEGVEFFVNVLFSKHQTIDDEDTIHLLKHIGGKELTYLFRVAIDAPVDGEDEGSPKAEAGPPTG